MEELSNMPGTSRIGHEMSEPLGRLYLKLHYIYTKKQYDFLMHNLGKRNIPRSEKEKLEKHYEIHCGHNCNCLMIDKDIITQTENGTLNTDTAVHSIPFERYETPDRINTNDYIEQNADLPILQNRFETHNTDAHSENAPTSGEHLEEPSHIDESAHEQTEIVHHVEIVAGIPQVDAHSENAPTSEKHLEEPSHIDESAYEQTEIVHHVEIVAEIPEVDAHSENAPTSEKHLEEPSHIDESAHEQTEIVHHVEIVAEIPQVDAHSVSAPTSEEHLEEPSHIDESAHEQTEIVHHVEIVAEIPEVDAHSESAPTSEKHLEEPSHIDESAHEQTETAHHNDDIAEIPDVDAHSEKSHSSTSWSLMSVLNGALQTIRENAVFLKEVEKNVASSSVTNENGEKSNSSSKSSSRNSSFDASKIVISGLVLNDLSPTSSELIDISSDFSIMRNPKEVEITSSSPEQPSTSATEEMSYVMRTACLAYFASITHGYNSLEYSTADPDIIQDDSIYRDKPNDDKN